MADMAEMEMPLPDNTIPMMTGQGPFGSVEMGGMFSVLKVRGDQKRGDYSDPGWFQHPPGTVAQEWTSAAPAATRSSEAGGVAMPQTASARSDRNKTSSLRSFEVQVRKPGASGGHGGH